MDYRGIAIGSAWFNERETAIERLASLKGNTIWNNGGSSMNAKFGQHYRTKQANWRNKLTKHELKILQQYQQRCQENFITPFMSLRPAGKPAPIFSSEKESQIVIDKFSKLIDLGFRNFALNFDDIQHVGQDKLTTKEDIKYYQNDVGKAHYDFANRVYIALKKKNKDISFTILPLWYHDTTGHEEKIEYLKTLAKLPKEVGFTICVYTAKGISHFTKLTGRKPLVWG